MLHETAEWKLFKGDYGVIREAELRNADGTSVNLSGKTAYLKILDRKYNVVLSKTLQIVSEVNPALVRWIVSQSDANTLQSQAYICRIEVVGTGYRETFGPFKLVVII